MIAYCIIRLWWSNQNPQCKSLACFNVLGRVGDLSSIPGDAAAQLADEISKAAAEAEKEKLKGNEQLKQGNTDLAYRSYSRAITLAPDQPVYYGNRAAAAITLKQYKQAVADGMKVSSLLQQQDCSGDGEPLHILSQIIQGCCACILFVVCWMHNTRAGFVGAMLCCCGRE